MDWADYEARISPLERASIHMAPMRKRPLAKEPFTYFPAELMAARFKAHAHVDYIAESLAKGHLTLEVTNIRFAECLVLARSPVSVRVAFGEFRENDWHAIALAR